MAASTALRLPPRYPDGGYIAGVCAGLAHHFKADVRLVRVLFVLLLMTGVGGGIIVPVYVALWILMRAVEPSAQSTS